MQTFLPYADFAKSAKCLDNRRLGKERVETWQIYNTLKQGEYKECFNCNGLGYIYKEVILCGKCKGTGKIKTAWYNHPITQMWKGFELALLNYGRIICLEWKKRGYKDSMYWKFLRELLFYGVEEIKYPSWLGNEKFHASMRSNLLRKNKEWYSQFGWKEKENLPYYWIKK